MVPVALAAAAISEPSALVHAYDTVPVNAVVLLTVTSSDFVSAVVIFVVLAIFVMFGVLQVSPLSSHGRVMVIERMKTALLDFQKYNVPCHIIGQLQTNKVKYLPPLTKCIQSVDSVKLAKEIDKQYTKFNSVADVLVEVNIGYEDSKSGIDIINAYEFIHEISELKGLHVKGLMCVPPICEGDMVRKYFAQMYQLFVDIQSKKVDNVNMSILSMGMSDDYKYAIMEGSNLIRVGSKIFGRRNYNI